MAKHESMYPSAEKSTLPTGGDSVQVMASLDGRQWVPIPIPGAKLQSTIWDEGLTTWDGGATVWDAKIDLGYSEQQRINDERQRQNEEQIQQQAQEIRELKEAGKPAATGAPPRVRQAFFAWMSRRTPEELALDNFMLAHWFKEEGGDGNENYIYTRLIPLWRREYAKR